jgi:hypothetical protein
MPSQPPPVPPDDLSRKPVFAHDRLWHDYGPGGGVLEPLVQLEEAGMGEDGAGHAQCLSPAWPHWLWRHCPGQQQRGVY